MSLYSIILIVLFSYNYCCGKIDAKFFSNVVCDYTYIDCSSETLLMSGAERINCSAVRSPSDKKMDTNMLERPYMAFISQLESNTEPNSNAVSGMKKGINSVMSSIKLIILTIEITIISSCVIQPKKLLHKKLLYIILYLYSISFLLFLVYIYMQNMGSAMLNWLPLPTVSIGGMKQESKKWTHEVADLV